MSLQLGNEINKLKGLSIGVVTGKTPNKAKDIAKPINVKLRYRSPENKFHSFSLVFS